MVCCRARDETRGLDLEGGGKGKNLQFIFVSKYILEADSIFRKVKN